MGQGSVHKGVYTCADCHMGVAYNAKGDPYANHLLTSPLDNAALLRDTCSMCHNGTGDNPADVPTLVKSIQEEITGREKVISGKLVQINTKLAAAIQSGSLADDVIEQIKKLDRDAQFYWDFVYVENAEGAHNSALSRQCLDKAEQLADQALALLG
jgi:nitrite reductase (cytochrome c-552)